MDRANFEIKFEISGCLRRGRPVRRRGRGGEDPPGVQDHREEAGQAERALGEAQGGPTQGEA